MKKIVILSSLVATLVLAPAAGASPYARYGVQDDAWLVGGAGTFAQRLDTLDRLGVDLVRFTLRWDQIATRRPADPRWSGDPAYAWGGADQVLKGLRARGIGAVVTLLGTPRWANGGRAPQVAPAAGRDFADFAAAAANRYPWVRLWTVWNEPNKRLWLRPVSPRTYVLKLLNPAYAALKQANRNNKVAGGVTAPRGGAGGMSPVAFIRGMKAARARLDAYAHHPYYTHPRQTPYTGGCTHCSTITMPTLGRLLAEVRRAFGRKRIWLTEYGYQTRPEDRFWGVSYAKQARYHSQASRKVWATPYVDMLIQFIVRDDGRAAGWQSGFITAAGRRKPSFDAFRFPLEQAARKGTRTVLWGQVRPRSGRQPYRLRQHRGGRWVWVGPVRWTNARGALVRTVRAGKGARFQVWSPRDRASSIVLVVR